MDVIRIDPVHQGNSNTSDLDQSMAVGCISVSLNKFAQKARRKLQQNTCQPLVGKASAACHSNKVSPCQVEESEKENDEFHGYYQHFGGDSSLVDDEWMIVKVCLEKKKGLGFCIKGRSPVIVSSVKLEGQANREGLLVADALYAINGHQVYQFNVTEVADIIRSCKSEVILEVRRPRRIIDGCSFSTLPHARAAPLQNPASSVQQHPNATSGGQNHQHPTSTYTQASVVQSISKSYFGPKIGAENIKSTRCDGKKTKQPKYASMREKYLQETYGMQSEPIYQNNLESTHKQATVFGDFSWNSSHNKESICSSMSGQRSKNSTLKQCSPVSLAFMSNESIGSAMETNPMETSHMPCTKKRAHFDTVALDNLTLQEMNNNSVEYRSAPSLLDAYLVDSYRQVQHNQDSLCLSQNNYTANTLSLLEKLTDHIDQQTAMNHKVDSCYSTNRPDDHCDMSSVHEEKTLFTSPEIVRKGRSSSSMVGYCVDMTLAKTNSKSSCIYARSTPKNEDTVIIENGKELFENLHLSSVYEFPEMLQELPISMIDRIPIFHESKESSVDNQTKGNQRNNHFSTNEVLSYVEDYVQFMLRCVDRFSKPLRFNTILTRKQYHVLFRNIEQLTSISHGLLTQLQSGGARDLDTETMVAIFKAKLPLLYTCFGEYVEGMPTALGLLNELDANASWTSFLQNHQAAACEDSDHPSLESFLWMPLCHVTKLLHLFSAVNGPYHKGVLKYATSNDLSFVLGTLSCMVENIQETDYDYVCDLTRVSTR